MKKAKEINEQEAAKLRQRRRRRRRLRIRGSETSSNNKG